MIRSMVFVEIVGRFLRRKVHSSCISLPVSLQLPASSATRIFCAICEMRSRLFTTDFLLSMWALNTPQLLMADCRGLPV